MANAARRRPLPALIALVALLLLTGLVWWRVLGRNNSEDTKHVAKKTCATASSASASASTAAALPAPSAVTVAVLNSTTKKGVATKARSTLISAGFKSPGAAGNDSVKKLGKITSVGELRYGPTGKSGAMLLRFYLPGSTLVATTSRTATVVVSLGTAYRGVASTATVQAALKKADLMAGTPSRAAC